MTSTLHWRKCRASPLGRSDLRSGCHRLRESPIFLARCSVGKSKGANAHPRPLPQAGGERDLANAVSLVAAGWAIARTACERWHPKLNPFSYIAHACYRSSRSFQRKASPPCGRKRVPCVYVINKLSRLGGIASAAKIAGSRAWQRGAQRLRRRMTSPLTMQDRSR